LSRNEIAERFESIAEFSGVRDFLDTPVKHYSTGMYLRLAFAVAAHLEPDILLIDEVLAVGDVAFQTKCLGKMNDVAQQGRTVLFVSHNMGAIRSLCHRAIVMNNGTVAAIGEVGAAIETYYRLVGALSTNAAQDRPGAGFGPVIVNGGSATIAHDAGFSATTSLRVPDDSTGYALYCLLTDMHGRRVFSLVETDTNCTPGRHAVRLECPPLWLATGLYSLYFKAIFWGSFQNNRAVSDTVPLDIVGGESRSDALLAPDARWTIEKCEGELATAGASR